MSPPPCTLFWPRSGLSPAPHRPTCPHEQRQVDEGEHVVDAVVVLGDAERPADLRPVGAGVGVGELADRLGGDAGDLRRRARASTPRPTRRTRRSRVVPRSMNDRVDQPGVDDLAGDRVRQGDVGADVRGRARHRRTAPSSCGAGRRRRAWRRCARPAARGGRRSGARRGAFEPHITMTSVSSISAYDEVPPPAPNTVARPTTVGACQVRLQESMLLVPAAARASFWTM